MKKNKSESQRKYMFSSISPNFSPSRTQFFRTLDWLEEEAALGKKELLQQIASDGSIGIEDLYISELESGDIYIPSNGARIGRRPAKRVRELLK